MNEVLIFNELSERKNELQNTTLKLIKEKNEKSYFSLKEELKNVSSQEELKIAFVGQHNAGKSTIVSALTGNHEIKISNNVETDMSADYKWNDVYLTDTPGLYAGVKEEHDERTLESIKQSDLLIFCITSSLFDDLLMNNFINLAYNQMYKTKMFLLVNKMSQESGDFKELVNNYKETLTKTLKTEGGNFSDFSASFVDAHDYLDGVSENDKEMIDYSNFDSFIEALNKYISNKKLLAKLDTPCRILIDAIDTEITGTGTELDKSLTAVLRQAQSSIHIHSNNVKKYSYDIKSGIRNSIMAEANTLIAKLGSEEVTENDFTEMNEKIESITQKKVIDLQEYANSEITDMNKDISEVLNSDMGQFVIDNITNKKINVKSSNVNQNFERFASKYQDVSSIVTKGAAKIADASGVTSFVGKVSQASGSQIHNIVLNVGHFFGKGFKPWEAVKVADKLGKVAKGIGPVLSVVSLGIDIAGKVKDEDNIKKLEQSKKETFNQFSSIASDLADQIETQYKTFEKDVFGKQDKEIEGIRSESIRTVQNNCDYVNQLKEVRSNITKLVEDISNT